MISGKIERYKINSFVVNRVIRKRNMASFTVSFTGTTSVLQANFFPPIELDPHSEYCCGLLDFTTYNSIPNITAGKNNEFKFKYVHYDSKTKKTTTKESKIAMQTGAYEVEDILNYLKTELAAMGITLSFIINERTSLVRITFNTKIEWLGGTLLEVLGFESKGVSVTFEKNIAYWGDDIVRITQVDVIRIDCDIVANSYINGQTCHTIHQFSHCKVKPGYKYIEVPHYIIYLPIKVKTLQSIQLSIVDQKGHPIDFRDEHITCRIHIKRVGDL